MKKLLMIGAIALMGTFAQAQEGHFKLGAHVGLPVGDSSEGLDFNAGVDLAYTWQVGSNFDLGLTTGYSHYFGEDVTTPAIIVGGTVVFPAQSYKVGGGIVPIAATGQYNFDGGFNIGADLGYAFFTGENSEGGGFYYQPKIGYTFGEKSSAYVGYKGVSDDGSTLSSINLGYAYKF